MSTLFSRKVKCAVLTAAKGVYLKGIKNHNRESASLHLALNSTLNAKNPSHCCNGFLLLGPGDGPADGQRPRVQSVESETIHFPTSAKG